MTDEITKATVTALLARWQTAWASKQKEEALINEHREKAYQFDRIIGDCKSLIKSVGFDRDDKDSWSKVPSEWFEGAKALYDHAKANDPNLPEWILPKKREPDAEFDADTYVDDGQPEPEVPGRPSIRAIALDRLAAALPNGLKAADIRRYIVEIYKTETHEKTVGMTLYRLSQEIPPKVRREGHVWFSVAPEGETKDPGVGAPGQTEMPS